MKRSRLVFVCSLTGLFLVVVIVVLAMKAGTNAPMGTPLPPEAPPAGDQRPAAVAPDGADRTSAGPEEVPADTQVTLDEDSLLADVIAEVLERDQSLESFAAFSKGREELFDRIYKTEEVNFDGLTRKRTTMRVSREEAIEMMKEFVDKFSSSPWAMPEMLIQDQMRLGAWEYQLGRAEEARQTLETATSKLPEGSTRDSAIVRWARMEKDSGDVAYAERLLADLASSAIPQQHIDWVYQEMEKERRLEAPLMLASIYRETGRTDDARRQIDEVKRFALALNEDHQAYGNLPWFYGRTCREEINIIFDRAEASDVESAIEKAEAIATDYETALADYRSRGSEHSRKYVDDFAKGLREFAQSRADKVREAAGSQ